jgi:protein-tyrosine-phosphatase
LPAPMPAAKNRLTLESALAASARRVEPALSRVLDLGPIRWPLHRRALRAWRATDEPLIVCTGNINRSPFAAQLARRRPASRAQAAGLYPEAGRPSPTETVTAAHARGVDLGAHRSVVLDDAMVARAAAIFVFDLQHVACLAIRWPRALRRTHFLGALADSGHVIIVDPHGRERLVLERTLTQITSAIESADLARLNSK